MDNDNFLFQLVDHKPSLLFLIIILNFIIICSLYALSLGYLRKSIVREQKDFWLSKPIFIFSSYWFIGVFSLPIPILTLPIEYIIGIVILGIILIISFVLYIRDAIEFIHVELYQLLLALAFFLLIFQFLGLIDLSNKSNGDLIVVTLPVTLFAYLIAYFILEYKDKKSNNR